MADPLYRNDRQISIIACPEPYHCAHGRLGNATLQSTEGYDMPTAGELTYFSRIGEAGRHYAISKPFAGDECPILFADLALLFAKLPRPPARVLECGCGTGWLSYFLAKRGYDVTGQDVSEEALALARENPTFTDMRGKIEFICSDFEGLKMQSVYDAVVFYGSLHHATDELAAIRCAYETLKPGGMFISFEPGVGHEKASQAVIATYDVGDRDMPPFLQFRQGKKVGFRNFECLVHPAHLQKLFHRSDPPTALRSRLLRLPLVPLIAAALLQLGLKRRHGVAIMYKP